jgi:outer membrane immunogenic protein
MAVIGAASLVFGADKPGAVTPGDSPSIVYMPTRRVPIYEAAPVDSPSIVYIPTRRGPPVYEPAGAALIPIWTGCYGGFNAGWIWARSSVTWSNITESPTGFAPGAATLLPAAANANLTPNGFIGGGQLGCNYQSGAFVFGGEADFQYTQLKADRSAATPAIPTLVPADIRESFSSQWLSTVRGRLGYAIGGWLVYATGGLAVADVSYFDQSCFTTAALPTCNTSSSDTSRLGWTVGGGVEVMLDTKWSLKAEYLYVDLGNTTTSGISTTLAGATPFPQATITRDHHLTENIARIGLNYKFFSPSAPPH